MYFKVYKLKFLLALLLLPFLAMAQPTGWEVTETPLTHVIIVPDALPLEVDGIPVENGDFIGVFFDNGGSMVCGGYVELGAGLNNNFVAFGEFIATPGFSFGEAFAWRFYDNFTGTEYPTEATYSAGGNVWNGTASTLASFTQAFSVLATANPGSLCAPGDVTLNAVCSDPLATFEWFIGASSIGTGQPLVYALTETTTFTVVATNGVDVATADVTVLLSAVEAGTYDGGCVDVPTPILLDGAMASPGLINIHWVTSGTGTFNNANLLNATYTPSIADLGNGSVTLTLSGLSLAGCGELTDDVTIAFALPPTVDLPEFVFTCVPVEVEPDPVDFTGLATVANYSQVQWASVSSLSNLWTPSDTDLNATFYPSPTDVDIAFDQGYLPTLVELIAFGIDPCLVAAHDTVSIYYVRPPAVFAGDPYGFCIDPLVTSYTFSGATVAFDNNPALAPVAGSINNTIVWTTDGGGMFDDVNAVNPEYTFGGDDLLGGVINFTVTAETVVPFGSACDPVSSSTTITVQAPPSINIIPASYTICEGDSMNFAGLVEGANYESLQWYTTIGEGLWSSQEVLEPIYYPSPIDIWNFAQLGICSELWVAAAPFDPCVISDEDMMFLCYQLLPVVVAGADDTICSNQTFTTNPTVENSNGPYMWTENGFGYFENPTDLIATYVAHPDDANTVVTLTLTAGPIGPCAVSGEGSMELTILCAPTVDAGADFTVCETENPTLTGVVDCVSDHMWATTGDGTFCCPQDLVTTYCPGPGDLAGDGCVTLVLIGYPLEPCTMYELDKVVVCFDKAPMVNAGPDMTICEDATAQLNGSSANVCGLQWVTFDGTGSFSNENIVNPIYEPSAQDFISGTVHLILIGAPCGTCTEPAIDTMALTIQRLPVIDAGDDEVTICENGSYTSIATITNYSGLLWTTTGDGTFDDDTFIWATYTPGPNDKANGVVIITLTAAAVEPCLASASADIIIHIQMLPTVNILPDSATICYDQPFDFTGLVEAGNYNAIQWYAPDGVGIYTPNDTILEPTYNPSPLDYITGCIRLYVVVSPLDPCVGIAATDSLILCFQPPVNIDIEDGALICEDATYTPAPYLIENACGVLWTTDGDGTFDDDALEYPVYTPGGDDLAAGSVVLHVTGIGCSTCDNFTADVSLSFQLNPIADAGPDGVVCEHLCLPPWTNGQYQLAGGVTNASGQMWTTAGDGAFSDDALLNAVYTIGDGDIAAGSVELCLIAAPINPCTVSDTNCMTLSIQYFPIADAGDDQSICEGESAQLDGTTTYANGVFWDFAFMGEGDGTWNNQLIEDPIYTPGPLDIDLGYVELIMVAFPISPCTYPDADIMTLFIIQQPIANAGPDGTICSGETFPLTGATVENATGGVLWTTTGSGTFDPAADVVNPTYVPGVGEIGLVTLCLEALDGSACTAGYSDCMTLTILEPPTANAGADDVICETETFTTNPVVTNYSAVLWTSTGTGTFDNDALLMATYTPSAADILAGSVELCIEVFSLDPCNITVSDCLVLTFQLSPVVTPMDDMTVCETELPYCFDATAANYSSLLWSSNGTGTFANDTIEDACYTPSAEDLLAGFVELCLTAEPIGPCAVAVTECFVLSFQLAPVVEPLADATICEYDVPFVIDATASNYSSLLWTTTGTGTFNLYNVEDVEYSPSAADVLAGSVELCLIAQPNDPCDLPATECFTLNLNQEPALGFCFNGELADTGSQFEYCYNETVTVSLCTVWAGTGPFVVCYSLNGDPEVCVTVSEGENLFSDVLPVGSYVVTITSITDLNGCAAQNVQPYIAYVTINPEPVAAFCFNGEVAVTGSVFEYCYNETVTVDLCQIVAGAGPFEVCYTVNADTVCVTVDEGEILFSEVLPAGTYAIQIISIEDANGCMASDVTPYNATVIVNPEPVAAFCFNGEVAVTGSVFEYCYNETVTVDLCQIVAGTGPFVVCYTVNADPEVCITVNEGDELFSEVLPVGTYQIQITSITDANGCMASDVTPYNATVIVNEEPLLIFCFNGEQAAQGSEFIYCEDTEVEVTLCDVWGGEGPFEVCYTVNGVLPAVCVTVNQGDQLFMDMLPVGTHVVVVTSIVDANGCSPSDIGIYQATVIITPNPTVYAGASTTICEGMTHTFADATTTNSSSLLWTGGLGTFDDDEMLNATYTPALGEYGSVMLTLTAQPNDPCTMVVWDTVFVTIQQAPVVNAGDDALICEGGSYMLDGSASFVDSVMWSGGLGTFDDPTSLTATYTPAVGETGTIVLTLTGYPMAPCADEVFDVVELTIQPLPVITPMNDMIVCDNVLTIPVLGIASNYTSVLWSGGNGFFDDDASLSTFYTVAAQDVLDGVITLCLTAVPVDPCQGSVEECFTITFDPSPAISDLQDATICEGDLDYCFTGVTVTDYSTLLWTGGDGSFDDPTAMNPCYTPGPADVIAGEVVLTLTAQPEGGCDTPAVDAMTLFIVADPTIILEPEMELTCDNYDFVLEQWLPIGLAPVVANYTSVLWTTTGDGTFDNALAASTQYNIGSLLDKWNGSVTLTLTAYGDDNCGVVATASITILIPQQIIQVLPGTIWRGISSYVDKSTTSVADVMDPVVVVPGSQSLVIMINKNGKYFWPVPIPAINQLGLWQPIGYKAKFKAEGCLPIYGDMPFDTVAHSFAVSGSYTYVPCLTNYPVLIDDLFAGFEDQILLIYSWEEGTLWVPEPIVNPLQYIRPGSAYLLVNQIGADYSVTFPDFDLTASIVANAVVPPAGTDYVTPWNLAVNTSQPHFILFADEVIGSMQAGDIVGAFDQFDECVGTTEIDVRNGMIKLLAMGDDPSTEAIDGFEDGENMTFKLYRPSTDETFDVTFTYDANYPNYDNKFAIYGVSKVAGMTMTLTSLNELVVDRNVNVYPNPANEVINIASDYDLRSVTLVNYVGQTVFSQVVTGNDFQINVSTFVNGMYFVRIETTQGNVITKPISIQ
jgi:hypothetical protein